MTVDTWYGFLLRHLVRPYQLHCHGKHVGRLKFVNGRSARYVLETNIEQFYFNPEGEIYIDKVSQFACKLQRESGGKPIARLQQVFDRICIDECQDLAGYDLELIELLLDSDIEVVLVGDHRQATFQTNKSAKNKGFGRAKIIDKFEEWAMAGRANLDYQTESHRCVQTICDFSDQLFPNLPKTTSLNTRKTGHDGVFALHHCDVAAYMDDYAPQTLRYSRATKNVPGTPLNFGEAKGMTFERTLIFPHKKLEKYLQTGVPTDAGEELAKIYVAVTRAKQSAAFVLPDKVERAVVPFQTIRRRAPLSVG